MCDDIFCLSEKKPDLNSFGIYKKKGKLWNTNFVRKKK